MYMSLITTRIKKNFKPEGEGIYIFFNPTLGDYTFRKIMVGLARIVNGDFTDVGINQQVVGIYNSVSDWNMASRGVRAAVSPSPQIKACGDVIDTSFFTEGRMRYQTNIIILNYGRPKRGHTPSPTGFATLRDLSPPSLAVIMSKMRNEYFDRQWGQNYPQLKDLHEVDGIYIETVCSSVRGGGVRLMDLVIALTYASDYKCVKLSSLPYVIQYYFMKFSFRFRKSCATATTKEMQLNHLVPSLKRISNDDDETEIGVWRDFFKKARDEGFATAVGLEKHFYDLREVYEEGQRIMDYHERLEIGDEGWKMTLCFNNPGMGFPQEAKITPLLHRIINESGGQRPRRAKAHASVAAASSAASGKGGSRKKKRRLCIRRRVRKMKDGTYNKADIMHNKKCYTKYYLQDNPGVLNRRLPKINEKQKKKIIKKYANQKRRAFLRKKARREKKKTLRRGRRRTHPRRTRRRRRRRTHRRRRR